jgi:hypothetical protein
VEHQPAAHVRCERCLAGAIQKHTCCNCCGMRICTCNSPYHQAFRRLKLNDTQQLLTAPVHCMQRCQPRMVFTASQTLRCHCHSTTAPLRWAASSMLPDVLNARADTASLSPGRASPSTTVRVALSPCRGTSQCRGIALARQAMLLTMLSVLTSIAQVTIARAAP